MSEMPELPEVGDRIRVSDEGVVEEVMPLGNRPAHRVFVRRDNGKLTPFLVGPATTATFEIINKAERLVDGAVYVDKDGCVLRWDAGMDAFWEIGLDNDNTDMRRARAWPDRPLRKVSR